MTHYYISLVLINISLSVGCCSMMNIIMLLIILMVSWHVIISVLNVCLALDIVKSHTLNINVMSEIGARFVKILRDLIVRDIRKLLQNIVRDLKKSQVTKQYAVIFQLIEGAILVTNLVTDYKKCKNVIGDIINIIEFALRGTRINIPPFLLFLSTFRTGFNDTRASLEVIKELQRSGIPTGPMPDGSPNLYLQSIISQIKGTESERTKNSKMVSMTPAQVITPSGFTVPSPMTGIPL